jgi:hypothetical protein
LWTNQFHKFRDAIMDDHNRRPARRDSSRGALPPGLISTHEVYRLDEAKRRLGWSDSAYLAARRQGLRVLVCGKRRYLSGTELLRFLESIAKS